MTSRKKDSRAARAGFVAGVLLPVILMPSQAWAQDMMGPDGLKLLTALPMLVVYAIGEFALFLAPLLLVLAIAIWVVGLVGGKIRGLPSSTMVGVLALVMAIPAVLYWRAGHERSSGKMNIPPSTAKPDRKMDPLPPPVGKAWPKVTGVLPLPQGAHGGQGTIVVSGKASFRRHYVKLCVARQPACPGLRHAFLQKNDSLRFGDLPPGEYEVRYMPIDRPVVGGKSRPIRIQDYLDEPHVFGVSDSPVLETPRDPVIGIYLKDF